MFTVYVPQSILIMWHLLGWRASFLKVILWCRVSFSWRKSWKPSPPLKMLIFHLQSKLICLCVCFLHSAPPGWVLQTLSSGDTRTVEPLSLDCTQVSLGLLFSWTQTMHSPCFVSVGVGVFHCLTAWVFRRETKQSISVFPLLEKTPPVPTGPLWWSQPLLEVELWPSIGQETKWPTAPPQERAVSPTR